MGLEIERKFLVNKGLWAQVAKTEQERIKQGYLVNEPGKTIRIRLTDTQGYITIKGKTTGISRAEYEYTIPREDAEQLLEIFCRAVVNKTRTKIKHMDKTWEIDEFAGDNEGLIVAEIELESETETFDIPGWIDREVTDEDKYYNANLSLHPYKDWTEKV